MNAHSAMHIADAILYSVLAAQDAQLVSEAMMQAMLKHEARQHARERQAPEWIDLGGEG